MYQFGTEHFIVKEAPHAPYCDCMQRPLVEHISVPNYKAVGEEKKCFGVTIQALRQLPFGDIATAQRLAGQGLQKRKFV